MVHISEDNVLDNFGFSFKERGLLAGDLFLTFVEGSVEKGAVVSTHSGEYVFGGIVS